jgi:hypothetical protein
MIAGVATQINDDTQWYRKQYRTANLPNSDVDTRNGSMATCRKSNCPTFVQQSGYHSAHQ